MTVDASSPDRRVLADIPALPIGAIASIPTPLLRQGDRIALVGAQLAAALVRPLAVGGFRGVDAERRHRLLAEIAPEAPEYEAYGNGYGEIAGARAFRQLAERAARTFTPAEDRWHDDGRVVDPFRPNLRYAASNDREYEVLAERHLNVVRGAFRRARVVLAVLTTAEVWEARADGAAFPHVAQHGAARFDPERHRIRMPDVGETTNDLRAAIAALRAINPGVEIVLMVSPELPPATALPAHLLASATLGKAVLRVAMEAAARTGGVHYFPALEIGQLVAAGETVDGNGSVPARVTAAIADALLAISEGGSIAFEAPEEIEEPSDLGEAMAEPPVAEPVAAMPEPPPPERRKRVQPVTVDSYTEIEAAQAKRREDKRAEVARLRALQAAAQADGGADTPAKPSAAELREQRVAERRRLYEERIAARDARRAAVAEAAAARAARRQRAAEARLAGNPAGKDVPLAPPHVADPPADPGQHAAHVVPPPVSEIAPAAPGGPHMPSPEPSAEPRSDTAEEPASTEGRRGRRSGKEKSAAKSQKHRRRKTTKAAAADASDAAEQVPATGGEVPPAIAQADAKDAGETGAPVTAAPAGSLAGKVKSTSRRKRDRPAKE